VRSHNTEAASGGDVEVDKEIVDALLPALVHLVRNAVDHGLEDETVRAADVVVTMGCGDACPVYPGKHYEDWEITDPEGQSIESVRAIRDEIHGRVENLIAELLVPGRSA